MAQAQCTSVRRETRPMRELTRSLSIAVLLLLATILTGVGNAARADEVQAAVLRVKLRYLDQGNRARARVAAQYYAGLGDCDIALPAVRPAGPHRRARSTGPLVPAAASRQSRCRSTW